MALTYILKNIDLLWELFGERNVRLALLAHARSLRSLFPPAHTSCDLGNQSKNRATQSNLSWRWSGATKSQTHPSESLPFWRDHQPSERSLGSREQVPVGGKPTLWGQGMWWGVLPQTPQCSQVAGAVSTGEGMRTAASWPCCLVPQDTACQGNN